MVLSALLVLVLCPYTLIVCSGASWYLRWAADVMPVTLLCWTVVVAIVCGLAWGTCLMRCSFPPPMRGMGAVASLHRASRVPQSLKGGYLVTLALLKSRVVSAHLLEGGYNVGRGVQGVWG